jgi:outer membrane autotransporter protein
VSAASLDLAVNAGASGTLNIGAASGSAAQAAGTLNATSLSFGAGAGTLVFNHTDGDYRFATAMAGAGTIAVEHGRTVLTGESAGFAGSTAISSGATLQVGDGATKGSFGGAIRDDGALVFDRADDTLFTGSISGTGSLTKAGSGTLLLTGDSHGFTGTTALAAGGLRVEGSLAGSRVTAGTGTTLSGSGTVGSVVAQAGSTVAPGSQSLGTLGVTGDYHQLAGATYAVDVVQDSSLSDRISIGGAATLDTGAVLDVTARGQGGFTVNDNFTVLSAAGGVSGTYILTGDTAISGFYSLGAVYDANNVYLRAMQTRDFADAALTPNEEATAEGLQSLPPDNGLRDAVASLNSDAEARHAFNQLSGELHPSVAGAMVEDSRFIRNAAVGRLRCSGAERPQTVDGGCGPGRVWTQAYGAGQNTEANGETAALRDDVDGFLIGADAPLPAGWQAGVLAGTAHAALGADARNSSASSDSYTLGAYGGMEWNDLGIRLGAAYSWYSIDSTRNAAFSGFAETLDADYQASTAQLFGEVGYTIALGKGSIEPFAGLAQVNVHSDGFTEQGGDAALSGDSSDTDITFSTLGLRTAANFTLANLRWTASGMAGWQHGWGDLTPDMVMNFAGSDSFSIHGAPIAEDVAALEAGLAVGEDGISIGVFYQGQFGDGVSAQGAMGRLAFAF